MTTTTNQPARMTRFQTSPRARLMIRASRLGALCAKTDWSADPYGLANYAWLSDLLTGDPVQDRDVKTCYESAYWVSYRRRGNNE